MTKTGNDGIFSRHVLAIWLGKRDENRTKKEGT